jgi:DNA protecting protein DprA
MTYSSRSRFERCQVRPWALFGSGDPLLLSRLRPGCEIARTLGHDLARAGLTVISGLAFGIDACAHRGALEAGATAAVLGCGADICYPANHRSLWRRISENGLVISEMPLGSSPWRWIFPARNRIVAALAGMTVVVEAAQRSGSLITANLAADLGRTSGLCRVRSTRAVLPGRTISSRAAPAWFARPRTFWTRCSERESPGPIPPGRN